MGQSSLPRRPREKRGPEPAPGLNRGPRPQRRLPWVPAFAGMTKERRVTSVSFAPLAGRRQRETAHMVDLMSKNQVLGLPFPMGGLARIFQWAVWPAFAACNLK